MRVVQLAILADSLSYIHDRRPAAWLTHLLRDRIRLLSGRLIVLTLQGDAVWLSIDAAADVTPLAEYTSWKWDTTSYPEYRPPPSRNGCYKPSADDGQEWPRIQRLHFAYLDRLLARARAFDHRSAARHEPLLVDYLTSALQRTVPNPPSVRLPEELPLSGRYWEGTAAQVIVNTFERDRSAREECLRLLGRKCVVCEMSFAQRYGVEMDGIIHVHHLIPLSDIREGYVPDPAHDLVPICPNCHAVIHARGVTRTVEEVRHMVTRSAQHG